MNVTMDHSRPERQQLGTRRRQLAFQCLEPRLALAAGAFDVSFSADGAVSTAIGAEDDRAPSIAIQRDGKIVAAGSSVFGITLRFTVARYNTNGSLDPTFSGDGKLITAVGTGDDHAVGVAIQTDGKIVVGGTSTVDGYARFSVVRYNVNGSLDTSFSGDGKVTTAVGVGTQDNAYAMTLQADNKIILVGSSSHGFAVVRYLPNGNLDSSFDGDGKLITAVQTVHDAAYAVAVQPDGRIVAVGTSRNTSNKYDFAAVRYLSDGTLDTSFGGDGKVTTALGPDNDFAYAVAVQADGKIVAAGESSYGHALARYKGNGTLDSSFGGDGKVVLAARGYDPIRSIVFQANGKIVALGNGYLGFGLTRFYASGGLDPKFGTDGRVELNLPMGFLATPSDMALQSDGKLLVAGDTQMSDTDRNCDFALARYIMSDPPVLSNVSGTIAYVQNASAVIVAPLAAVSDSDNANFAAGKLTVRIASGGDASNRLLVGGAFSVVGGNVQFNGTIVGALNLNGGVGLTKLEITLNSKATLSVVQQLLRSIRFRTLAGTSTVQRVVTFTLSDGDGGISATVKKRINVS